MTSVQSSQPPLKTIRTDGAANPHSANTPPSNSALVIGLLSRGLGEDGQPSTSTHTSPLQTQAFQRIEQLLRQAVADKQPSLAEQISQLIKNTPDPLTNSELRTQVEQLLNQPSNLDPMRSYSELIQTIQTRPLPVPSATPISISRVRRELENPDAIQPAHRASVRAFADAWVDKSDHEQAKAVAQGLVSMRLAVETGEQRPADIQVPVSPDSTFGIAWNELADALQSEPFKSFAEARNINLSNVFFESSGNLIEYKGSETVNYRTHQHPEWAAASVAVAAAVKKLAGNGIGFAGFRSREQAPPDIVANFYKLDLGPIESNDTLFAIGQLLRDGTFNSLNNTDPLYAARYAPVRRQQAAAQQAVANLPPAQLNERIAKVGTPSAEQRVKEADQKLAEMAGRAALQMVREVRGADPFPFELHNIPEHSTYSQVRQALLRALNTAEFHQVLRDKNLELSSVRINPSNGDLTGTAPGSTALITITVNDIDWGSVWPVVEDAVKRMAADSSDEVAYPSTTSARPGDLLAFYNESHIANPPGRAREGTLLTALRKSNEIYRNNGFKVFASQTPADEQTTAIRDLQQSVISRLGNSPIQPTPLEQLAAAIHDSAGTQTAEADTPLEAMAKADSELAVTVHRAMLEVKTAPTSASSKMIDSIPANSLFAQWRDYLGKALNSKGFTEWAGTQNIDLKSLRFDPTDKALIAKINGHDQRFTADSFAISHPEYFDVLGPVLTAAAAFAAPGKTITLSHANTSSIPLDWVCRFYGVNTDYTGPAFEQLIEQMGRTQQFPNNVEKPERMLNWLVQQKAALGNSNDRYNLIHQLKHGNIDNDDSTRFVVDADSEHQPKGTTTVQKFLADHGWYGATTAAETSNLLQALQTQMPQSPPSGHPWGFLATDLPLSEDQRTKVIEFVKTAIAPQTSFLSYLRTNANPLELATNLEREMAGATTATSLQQWLMTALILDLDPAAGSQRNSVAGFDFMQRENWGLDADAIRQRFVQHLLKNPKVPAHLAQDAANALLAGSAQVLKVKDIPSSVVLGSTEWVSLETAVKRIELSAPGATTGMSYEQVMKLHKIKPISAEETRLLGVAQMNPVIDWAIINNHIKKSDNDEYSLEQSKDSQEKLQKTISEVADARRFLSTVPAPIRRVMALEQLKSTYGSDIDFLGLNYIEKLAGGLFSGTSGSIVEIYEANRLGEDWAPLRAHDFARIRAKAHELPDINKKFDEAVDQDFPPRRAHTITLFKDMLRKLPVDQRYNIDFGSVEFLQVEVDGTGVGLVLSTIAKDPKTDKDIRMDFAVYPASGKIERIPEIDSNTVRLGYKTKLSIDAQAFKSGAPPRSGVESEVTLRRRPSMYLIESSLPQADGRKHYLLSENSFDVRAASERSAESANNRVETLAASLVDSFYLRRDRYFIRQHGVSNGVETAYEPSDLPKDILHVLPGGSSLIDLYHGEFAKAGEDLAFDIALYAATEGAGKAWSVIKSGAAWAATKASAKFIEKFGAREAESILLKDVTAASTSKALNSISRMQNSHIVELAGDASVAAPDKAEGRVIFSGTKGQTRVTAIMQDGKFYAYDTKTMGAYGPALENYVSDTSSILKQETFADGTKALVTEKPLAEDAYTVARTHGFDLINEGRVYRYDSRNPGLLRDLESAEYYKPLEGFEAVCPAPGIGGRVKRGANDTCFTKVIEQVSGELKQELQALEHTRLFPSAPKFLRKDQFVIFERRRWKMVFGEMGQTLHPVPESKPIAYKSKITGTFKNEPQFGFFHAQSSEAFEHETRVVKLDRITEAVDDKRELRGVIVDGTASGKPGKYLVIEADSAEFYYTKLDNAPGSGLTFNKCTLNELPMVKAYRNKFSIRQGVGNGPFDANFIALPKLHSAFEELERAGYLKEDVDEFKTACNELTEEQQREVVYQLQRAKAIGNADIALKPNQVVALDKPADFTSWTAERQNQFYAQQAQDKVNSAMKATGLGPANQISSKADVARSDAAAMTLAWLRKTEKIGALNRSNLILKYGAGNCGEMSQLSKDIIKKSGGKAESWYVNNGDHAFTVVGGPASKGKSTIDFLEDEWKDAWIVDPWAEISCKASEYTDLVQKKMAEWDAKGRKIYARNQWRRPLDPQWLKELTTFEKRPY